MSNGDQTVVGYALLDQVTDMSTAVVQDPYPYDFRAAYPNVGWGRNPPESQLLRIKTVPVVDVPSTDDPRDHTITPILPPSWDARGQWVQLYNSTPNSEGLVQAKVSGKQHIYGTHRSKVFDVIQGNGRFELTTESVKRNELSEWNGGPNLDDFPVLQGEQIGMGWDVVETVDNIKSRMNAIDVKLALYDKEKFLSETAIDAATSANDIDAIVTTYQVLI